MILTFEKLHLLKDIFSIYVLLYDSSYISLFF